MRGRRSSTDNDWDRSGVILSGSAVLRNSFVHDVRFACNEERAKRGLAGIYATGDSKVDNCTVTRCWSKYHPGGGINIGASATVRNCIAYGNTGGGTKQGTGDTPIDIRGGLAPAVFANCLVGVSEDGELPEVATDCLPLGTDPMFVDSGYLLDRKSPCINAGKRLEWTKNSVDIEGNVRRGSRPDIGCWESDILPGLVLMIR